MITLDDAKAKIAELDSQEYELFFQASGGEQNPGMVSDSPEAERVRELRVKRERLMQKFAGYYHLRRHMWCWMVDVHGKEANACSNDEMHEALEHLTQGELDQFTARVGGSLAQNVRDFITRELGMRITDCGGGCTGWDLGTPCDQAEMEVLTGALHGKFIRAIEAGLIDVRVKFWGWRFRMEEQQ